MIFANNQAAPQWRPTMQVSGGNNLLALLRIQWSMAIDRKYREHSMHAGRPLMSASAPWTKWFKVDPTWLTLAVLVAAIAHLVVGINAAFYRNAPLRTSIQLQACLGLTQPDELPAPDIICTYSLPAESHSNLKDDMHWWHTRIEEDFQSVNRPVGPELVLPELCSRTLN